MDKVNPNDIKTRDYSLVRLINGATKGGAHKNKKKDANRKACRNKKWQKDSL